MPRKARVNHNWHYMGPHPPAYGASTNMPMPNPQWTYQTKGTLLFPNLECDSCGGVLPGGRRLRNLFTRRCRCDDGASDVGAIDTANYIPAVADNSVYYTWDSKSVQAVELFRPNPLPELPESFKRIRAADRRAADKRASEISRKAHVPCTRRTARSRRRHDTSPGPISEEPAITFRVDDARRRLQHVKDTTDVSERLHPFLDTLLDALDDVAAERPKSQRRSRTSVVATPHSNYDAIQNGDSQPAPSPSQHAAALYPTPPLSSPEPLVPPMQLTATQVPSSRVPPSSIPPSQAGQRLSSANSPPTPPPERAPAYTPKQPFHRDTSFVPRSILKQHGHSECTEPSHLPSPVTPHARHTTLDVPVATRSTDTSSAIRNRVGTPRHAPTTLANTGSEARPQADGLQTVGPSATVGREPSPKATWAAAGSFNPPEPSSSPQSQTPLVHPRSSRPDSATEFSPLLRFYGSPLRSPSRTVIQNDDPSPPIYVRYEPTHAPFSALAPEAVTTSRFSVFGQHFWSVSQGLAWAKAYRYMHSLEDRHEDRIVARARQQEILNLSAFDDNFVPDTLRLYQETPDTPSWAMYELPCADTLTKAKIAGPDVRARDLLIHGTGDREILWDVNSMTWGRGRQRPDGRNAYGIILMNIREALRLRPVSPLIDARSPHIDVLYGLRQQSA